MFAKVQKFSCFSNNFCDEAQDTLTPQSAFKASFFGDCVQELTSHRLFRNQLARKAVGVLGVYNSHVKCFVSRSALQLRKVEEVLRSLMS